MASFLRETFCHGYITATQGTGETGKGDQIRRAQLNTEGVFLCLQ